MSPQCQVCRHPGVEMWDICEVCGWENDHSLEDGTAQDGSGTLRDVGFTLTAEQWNWGSWSNHTTPRQHYTSFIARGS